MAKKRCSKAGLKKNGKLRTGWKFKKGTKSGCTVKAKGKKGGKKRRKSRK